MSYQFGSVDPEDRAQYSGAPEPRRRRSLTATVLAVGVMALFAGALWFAYEAGTHHRGPGGVPLIHADESPAKVKPDSPDGMHVPDRNMLIYNESEPKIERLLPPAEQPLPRPAPSKPVPAAAAPAVPSPTPPQPPAAATSALPAPAPATARAAAPVVAPKAAMPTSAKPAAAGSRVQLGALRSPDLATREWRRLKHANADILGKLSASPVRADLGAKGIYYRIEVGPLATPEAAARLCGALKERNVGCMLVR